MDKTEQIDSKLQTTLKKLISNEYIAGQLYILWTLSVPGEQRQFVSDVFENIASMKMTDHMKALIGWCINNGYDIPCTDPEIRRCAADYAKKAISQTKRNKTAEECITLAIKLEQQDLIEYQEALKIKAVPEYTDLQSILWSIYYDCEENISRLNTMLTVS